MTFVTEDGTGIADANSYTSVAFYRAYFLDRGKDLAAQVDAQVQGYLVRATDYVEKRFGPHYLGTRLTLTQALGFPREGITIDGVSYDSMVPLMFQMGICEYAFRASKYAELAPDTPVSFEREDNAGDPVAAGGVVVETFEKVASLEESKKFSDPTLSLASWAMPAYPAADLLIERFVSSSRTGRTFRA